MEICSKRAIRGYRGFYRVLSGFDVNASNNLRIILETSGPVVPQAECETWWNVLASSEPMGVDKHHGPDGFQRLGREIMVQDVKMGVPIRLARHVWRRR